MADNTDVPRGQPERNAEIYRLAVVECWTHARIAEHHGISRERVTQILAAVRKQLPPPDLEEIRQQALAVMEDVQRRAYELATQEGAPVAVGKDGTILHDPETGAVVRDYGARIAALRLVLDTDEKRRRLMGADAAKKVESTAQIRYVLEGVNTDDLA